MTTPIQEVTTARSRSHRTAPPCAIVIFGASGDLTTRKLLPALYNLAKSQLLSREFAVIGVSHSELSTDQFRSDVSEDMKEFGTGTIEPDLAEWFVRRLYYLPGEFDSPKVYDDLKALLAKVDKDHSTHENYFYYLATAPRFFGSIVEHLAAAGLPNGDRRARGASPIA